jgi:hypothetical protein
MNDKNFQAKVKTEKHGGEKVLFLYIKNSENSGWSGFQLNNLESLKILKIAIEEKIEELENAD